MQSVCEAAGGWDGMLSLAEEWHARVMADEVVSHALSRGFHPRHTEPLASYWAEALGGPTTYSKTCGLHSAGQGDSLPPGLESGAQAASTASALGVPLAKWRSRCHAARTSRHRNMVQVPETGSP
jgi:hypothetical protein